METVKVDAWISVSELVENLAGRLSRNSIYEGLRRGDIPHIKIGKRILVRADVLSQMLEGAQHGK